MDTQERLNRRAIAQEWMTDRRHSNPVILVLLITFGSLIAGLMPFAYASVFGKESQPTMLTAGEAAIWSVFAEKDTSSDGANQ